ncbi:MAG: 16S rRNA (cytosine(967)-C(5))-methyltransferase [Cyanobacteriota bacterium]|nr:16S rRNA (cytosine(967)-C(5))-methyltransferase [Cyanobacteriota bacterium]
MGAPAAAAEAGSTGLGSRAAAWRVLQAVAAGAYADAALERELRASSLAPLDRALATDLAYGAIRQRRLLDAWIDRQATVPALEQPPPLRWLLHVGLQQLLFSDRVPAAAAVSTCVELAKRHGLARLAPVVNGILRGVLRCRAKALAAIPAAAAGAAPPSPPPWLGLPLPEDPASSLALRHSLPDWLAAELLGWLPPEQAEAFAAATHAPPSLDLRINPLRSNLQDLSAAFAAAGVAAAPVPERPLALTLPGGCGDPRSLPGFAEGLWCVQDRHAQAIVPLLDPQPGQRVLDACAAPGGKTTQIASLLQGAGELWAVDRSEARLRRVSLNAERLGCAPLSCLAADATALAALRPDWQASFDRILIDAPCSGLGTLARHADARWRINPAAIDALVLLQSRLLEGLAPLLAPGGRLVYATCTLHPRENGERVAAFLAERPAWRLLQERSWWPLGQGGDGFYAAVIEAPPSGERWRG